MVILGTSFATKYTGILELKLSNISGLPTDCFYFGSYHQNCQASASLAQRNHFCLTLSHSTHLSFVPRYLSSGTLASRVMAVSLTSCEMACSLPGYSDVEQVIDHK